MAEQKNGLIQLAFVLLTITLAAGVIVWFVSVFFSLIAFFPWGLLGLIPLIGLGLLIFIVVRDRVNNPDDDHYSKNVDQ